MHGQPILVLVVLAIVIAPIALAIWLITRANEARRRLDELARRLGTVELDLHAFKRAERAASAPATESAPTVSPVASPSFPAVLPERREVQLPATVLPPLVPETASTPLKVEDAAFRAAYQRAMGKADQPAAAPPLATAAGSGTPPPLLVESPASEKKPTALGPPPIPPRPPRPALPAINWENFLGVKLFAWIGGLLLFLGVAFFIKYSFENNLVKPPMRIALGYATGLGLLIGGLRMPRERYAVLVQTLCASAVLIFYGNTFAAHGMYHLIPQLATFALMTLVTAVAFVLAARLNGQVVAVLGILGGFLTPVLLSTGEDRPLGLFTYIALLDAGLIAIALRQRWNYLVLMGWIGTALMQIGWAGKFYAPEKVLIAMAIFLGFSVLFVGAFIVACRVRRDEKFTTAAALLAPGAALMFAFNLIGQPHPDITGKPALLFTFVLLGAGGWLVLANLRSFLRPAHLAGAAAVVLLLAIWSVKAPGAGMLNAALGLYLLFAALFVGMFALACRRRDDDRWSMLAGVGSTGAALLFALHVLDRVDVAAFPKPWLFFGYVFLADAGLLAMAAMRDRLRPVHLGAGGAVFLLLAIWTWRILTPELLNWALGVYMLFGLLHSVYPVVLERLRPSARPVWWAHLFPLLSLVLVALPIFKLSAGSFLMWPVILLIDCLGLMLALLTASIAAVIAVILLTLGVAAAWIFHLPLDLPRLPELLVVLGGFAVFLFVGGLFFGRKLLAKPAAGADSWASDPFSAELQKLFGARVQAHLPALPALLPFLLLTMLVVQLPLANPSPVFGLAALMLVLLFGLVRYYAVDALAAIGLVAVFVLEQTWHTKAFSTDNAAIALGWHLSFPVAFFVFPFLFRERFHDRVIPWAVSALALPLHFKLIYGTVKATWPDNGYLGLVPGTLAVPLLAALFLLVRRLPSDAPKRNTLLALFGGAALFFITLIFPIQFSNQWLTVAWALEGAALLWLFHRVPHNGLRIVGGALLVVAFARLALNPAVFHYHARSATPILNWYLYSYGLVTVALFAGMRLLAPPRERVLGLNLRALLGTLGTVLAFILLNIEIADYFSTGTRIEFRFTGSFALDMTYSLAWAVFAGIVLGVGVRRRIAAVRYAGLGLLVVTLLKLFFHDVWQLEGLYRMGAIFGLAVALLLVSFIYLKFLAGGDQKSPPPVPPVQ